GPMQDLANELKQSCHISIVYDRRLMVVSETRSPGPVSLSVAEGTLFPLVGTVSGRVLIAFSAPEQQQDLLDHDEQFTHMKPRERKQFLDRLEKTQSDRYELAVNGFTEGVTECAAVIGGHESGLVAALCVAAMSTGLRKRIDKQELVDAITKTARRIERQLGI
ncbi:MAG: IclR family transcriptional regulator C-terminal domain-containing protein, partial [Rhodopirellula sp. JB053]